MQMAILEHRMKSRRSSLPLILMVEAATTLLFGDHRVAAQSACLRELTLDDLQARDLVDSCTGGDLEGAALSHCCLVGEHVVSRCSCTITVVSDLDLRRSIRKALDIAADRCGAGFPQGNDLLCLDNGN